MMRPEYLLSTLIVINRGAGDASDENQDRLLQRQEARRQIAERQI